ncbi:MAG: putative phosphoesterase [Marinobacter excellens HL-55]|uniref:Putative phosphoesterase n=1 Tax=Marinobacter excellens HL-55 TaxID=1305731 RepID=A0A0P7ZMV0_9GAMM|nr:MAG: putative phosphoesterase [Marinobacter excellens HL-55]
MCPGMPETEGRTCPLAYRYRPEELCREPTHVSESVLYIVGGLYGNPFALDEIEAMVRAEERHGHRVKLVFNGDFNWFNADDALFREINSRVLDHTAILGNVDYELSIPNAGAGCGCAYPDYVDQGVVERSNQMMERLQAVADQHPDIQKKLSLLPRYQCLIFGGLKVLVVHGDPESLAGWGLSHESFVAGNQGQLAEWFRATDADIIASTHTCLPVLWSSAVDGKPRMVANNGAAGMGNLRSDPQGLVTRIGFTSPFGKPVAGVARPGLHVSLMPVAYDLSAWLLQFDRVWPENSPAAVSYRSRLVSGTSLGSDGIVFSSLS